MSEVFGISIDILIKGDLEVMKEEVEMIESEDIGRMKKYGKLLSASCSFFNFILRSLLIPNLHVG